MNRLIAYAIGAALLVAAAGFMIANAQQSSAPAFIAGDRPVTTEQVRDKLQTDGWSNLVLSRNGLCTITRSCTKSQEAAQKAKSPGDLFARDSSLAARFITVSQTG